MNDWNAEQGAGEKTLNRKYFAKVEWSKDDIATLVTDEHGNSLLSDKEIDEFIQEYEKYFQDRLIERGWDIWSSFINQYLRNKVTKNG